MKNCHALENQTTHRILLIVCATALAVAFTVALPQPANADPVPSVIEVPEGNVAFLEGHAVGTQNYICLPSGWTFIGPQATLFDDDDGQIITHFLSPSPAEGDTARDTWQPSLDTSRVWAMESASTPDPDFVEPGAIDRLLLQVVGRDRGPTGGRWLTETAYMPRVYTAGGLAPTTGCAHTRDIGQKALVPHIAD